MEEVLRRREERASKQKQQEQSNKVKRSKTTGTKRLGSASKGSYKRGSCSKGKEDGIQQRVVRRVTAKSSSSSNAIAHDDEIVYKDVLAAANCGFPCGEEDEVVVIDSDDDNNKKSSSTTSRKKKSDATSSSSAAASTATTTTTAAEELIAEMEYFTDVGYRPRGGVYSYVCCPQQLNPTYEKYFTTQDGGRTSSSSKKRLRAKTGVGSAAVALASVGDATMGVKQTSAVFADAMLNKLLLHDLQLPFPRAKICIVYLNVFDGWDSSECHRFSEYVIDGFDDRASTTEEEMRETAREALCNPVETAPAQAKVAYANVFAALANLVGIDDDARMLFSETIPGVQEVYDVPLRYRSLFERTLEPDAKCLTLCYNWKKEEISPCALVNTALNRCSERAFGTPSPPRAAGYTSSGVSSPMFMEPIVLLGHVEYIKKHFIAPELMTKKKTTPTTTPITVTKTHRIALLQAKEHAERMKSTNTEGLD
ncbi:hypothetical protein V5799_022908 [Amblyomma americanum]|uniref:Uncharacterized protein n=1 Tax=Amblyomma americanum TaxID=6943 RepID=A0AAQ4FJS0_AMBAM